jgi:prepilin-type processing-associated H-X9-DG protein
MIALVLGLLMLGVIVPSVHRAREAANKVKCGSNLKQIGQGLLLYANDNNGDYPRTRWNVTSPSPTQYTGSQASNPFAADGPADNDVTAAMFLLLRTQELTSAVFICPVDPAEAWNYDGVDVQQRSNFPGSAFLSYSLQNPYPGPAAAKDGFKWNNTLKLDFAVAADMNPGTQDVLTVNLLSNAQQIQRANSPNHNLQGQNILYGDGHVEFQQTPFCGVEQDNVYGVGRRTAIGKIDPIAIAIIGPPGHKDDSVLLPTAVGKPAPPSLPLIIGGIRWYTYISVLAFGGVIAAFIFALRQRPASGTLA